MKRAYHYVADAKGTKPVTFYVDQEPIASKAASAFSCWANADVVLWPTHESGVYRAQWFDRFSETYRESRLEILEEMR